MVPAGSSTTVTTTVELRRRWTVLMLVGAVVGITGLSIVIGGSSDDDPTTSTSPQVEEPAPEQQDLSTSVEVVGAPQVGAFYGIGYRGQLVQVDLASGSVTRSSETFSDASVLKATASGVIVVGSQTRIVDDTLDVVTPLEGQYLASRSGEIWTLLRSDDAGPDVQRYNEVGELDLTIPAGVLGNRGVGNAAREGRSIAGAAPERLSSAQGRRSSWWIDTSVDNPSISTDTAGPVFGVDGSGQAIRCAGIPPQCQWVTYRFGSEIDLFGSRDDVWSAMTGPSGKYALTDGPDGTSLVDMRRMWDESSMVPMQSGDTWAGVTDLIVRASDTKVEIVDLTGEVIASVMLPPDVVRRNRAPRWSPSLVVIHDG